MDFDQDLVNFRAGEQHRAQEGRAGPTPFSGNDLTPKRFNKFRPVAQLFSHSCHFAKGGTTEQAQGSGNGKWMLGFPELPVAGQSGESGARGGSEAQEKWMRMA